MQLKWVDPSGVDMGALGHVERGTVFDCPEPYASRFLAEGRAVRVEVTPAIEYAPLSTEVKSAPAPKRRVR